MNYTLGPYVSLCSGRIRSSCSVINESPFKYSISCSMYLFYWPCPCFFQPCTLTVIRLCSHVQCILLLLFTIWPDPCPGQMYYCINNNLFHSSGSHLASRALFFFHYCKSHASLPAPVTISFTRAVQPQSPSGYFSQ
ncbi:hypothetical protein P175DRAFT_0295893 [Aspergillus ochraceoroseus IBT 24754]|uniref:Uncharacterized protein n=1 Tax=Aspergillus ochraceoroseus IBT 24754 TaxID=1392256 RepID=A0A2T5LSN7_9EURO|nr:uncharacterized protein P175DRAFT_0295893 [Aspergillus ochraceoroseus IBT 24754]PTU19281.1 hypothetical protein P175DRAFT_0295893 [Aspergillus ochraceoroseus IBT 24754]